MRLLLLFAVSTSLIACAPKHGSGGDDDDAGSDYTLTISPTQSSITLAASGTGYSATQAYTVTAQYPDHDEDVTGAATITTDDPTVAVASGLATATAAGTYNISAVLDSQIANAVLDVQLVGSSVGSGVVQAGLDGTPDPSQVPTIAYPPAGALFPINLAPLEVHAQKSDPSQTIARVMFTSGADLQFAYYATCAASPNASQFPNACIVTIDPTFTTQLAGVSEADDVTITVRLAAADGTMLGESQPVTAAWSKTPLSGGLYYWTTAGTGDTTFNTAVARYDFDGDASSPTIYLSSANAPAVPQGQTQCIGCHAVSKDGSKMAFALGGSEPGYYSLYDVASVSATVSEFNATPFAEMTTFSPDGSREITMNYGDLSLRAANASLGMDTDHLFPEVQAGFGSGEEASHPFWSPTGAHIAFVSWTPSGSDVSTGHDTGDMVQGGQIWMASSDGTQPTGTAQVLVPRQDGITSYYPAISDDDDWVVFDQSSCSGPPNTAAQGWGLGACDGYNDISATLMMVPTAGGTPIELTNANGSASPLVTNSWPRWSPDHGTFRGKELYWVAFSSRRAYGLSLQSGEGSDVTKPQLWFAAVAIDPSSQPTTDPSYAAVWLPGQDPSFTGPRGNHTPVWTTKAVTIQ
jgi:Tol biopolymer transport system component